MRLSTLGDNSCIINVCSSFENFDKKVLFSSLLTFYLFLGGGTASRCHLTLNLLMKLLLGCE